MRSGYIRSVRACVRVCTKGKLLHKTGRGGSVVVWLRSRWCNFELTVAGDQTH